MSVFRTIYDNRLPFFKKWHVWVLVCMSFTALFADFMANGLPIYAKKDSENRFPVIEKKLSEWKICTPKADLYDMEGWTSENVTRVWWAPIRYSPAQTDRQNDRFQKPHVLRHDSPVNAPHYLGTDGLGHDVAAILIHGTAVSFFVGVFSMIIATLIGIMVGAMAGFWSDFRLKISLWQILLAISGIPLIWFYAIQMRSGDMAKSMADNGIAFLGDLLFSLLVAIAIGTIFIFIPAKVPALRRGKKYPLPVDFILSRLIEFMVVIPKIILILAIAAVAKPSVYMPALIIGLTAWPAIARFTRAEMLHVRTTEYMLSAETFGLETMRLFFVHALPNSLSPVPSLVAFGIAGAILAESTLSFLGIGFPSDVFTWGKLLAQGRTNPSAWWVTVLPGLMIFLTITSFHKLGESWQNNGRKLRPLLKYFV